MKIRWAIWAAVLVGAVGLFGPLVAASSLPFQNGTFQCNTCTTDNLGANSSATGGYFDLGASPSSTANDLAPWIVTAGTVDWITTYWQAPPVPPGFTGANVYSLDMNGVSAGTISQQFSTVSGATYFVSFDLSGNPSCGPTLKTLSVDATGGTTQPFSFDTVATTINGTTYLGSSVTDMNWTTEGYTFTASSASTTLTFTADPNNTSNCGPALGDVAVTQTSASGALCKDGGWQNMSGVTLQNEEVLPTFTNQGQCVSYFATSGDTPIGS